MISNDSHPTFFVTEKVVSMQERAEWIAYELGMSDFSVSDLPSIARVCQRFMFSYVKSGQQKMVLDLYNILSGHSVKVAQLPHALQEEFVQVWEPSKVLSRPALKCPKCGSSDFKKRQMQGTSWCITCKACGDHSMLTLGTGQYKGQAWLWGSKGIHIVQAP